MKISVTLQDIALGLAGNCVYCPIARAISRVKPGLSVTVFGDNCNCGYSNYALPRSAKTFIRKFDKGFPVEPFNFILPD